jgi:hypothetical protein
LRCYFFGRELRPTDGWRIRAPWLKQERKQEKVERAGWQRAVVRWSRVLAHSTHSTLASTSMSTTLTRIAREPAPPAPTFSSSPRINTG